MGVPTFFKWLCVKYPKILIDAKEPLQATEIDGINIPIDPSIQTETSNGDFDNLYLDMNGIIHPCCHPEDSEQPASEDEMFKSIFSYIDRLIAVVRPKKLLYMAIDGVAPRAKMNQQRMRRFKTAAEVDQEEHIYEELKQQFESEGRPVPEPKSHWDSNVITPGTPFFDRLTRALRYYINAQMSNNSEWRSLNVILSDASCPGEGEHKIMQYIRSQRTYPEYDPNLRHCLYGADADLIMLGLATHEPHFTILREAVLEAAELRKCYLCGRTGHLASDCTGDPAPAEHAETQLPATSSTASASWKPLQFLRIAVLREYLQHEFSFNDTLNFEPDIERCIDDFVLMCFFVGNDFLPHLPSLSIHKGSIDQMILLYQKIRPLMSEYLTDAGKIHVGALKTFVSHLGSVEEVVFREDLKRQQRMKAKRTEDEARVAAKGAEREARVAAKGAEREAMTRVVEDENFAALSVLRETEVSVEESSDLALVSSSEDLEEQAPPSKRQKVTREENIDYFKEQLRSKQKAANEIDNPRDFVQLGVGNSKEWKLRYYRQKFHLTDEDLEDISEFSSRVATAYTEGMSWVLAYYYQGVCSWEWYYPFHYAPFASDIADFGLEKQSVFILGKPFKPFEQLMAVLPARSGHCLPLSLSKLMTDTKSPIIDFYPKKFKEDPDGKRFKWQWVVLLPFIDEKRLLDTIRPLESLLLPSERERNSCGIERIFVSQFHSLAQQIALVQTGKMESEREQKIISELSDCISGKLSYSKRGFVSGTLIDAGPDASKELFFPLPATCFSCEFTCEASCPHSCRFLAGARPPEKELTNFDFQDDLSRDRRFNAGAAKRIIIGSLGRSGIVDKETVDRYFRHPRDTQPYHAHGIHSDNRYQAEMFGSDRAKRGRVDEWDHSTTSLPERRQHSDYNQGGHNQGGHNQGGHNQGGHNQGGHNQGGYNQGGHNQRGHNQGGYNQGGYNQGGYKQQANFYQKDGSRGREYYSRHDYRPPSGNHSSYYQDSSYLQQSPPLQRHRQNFSRPGYRPEYRSSHSHQNSQEYGYRNPSHPQQLCDPYNLSEVEQLNNCDRMDRSQDSYNTGQQEMYNDSTRPRTEFNRATTQQSPHPTSIWTSQPVSLQGHPGLPNASSTVPSVPYHREAPRPPWTIQNQHY